jgi:hypothetical protein
MASGMTWGRGFFRLWALGALLWICGIGWLKFEAIAAFAVPPPMPPGPCREVGSDATALQIAQCDALQRARRRRETHEAAQAATLALAPPLALLALGFAIRWVGAGFRPPRA